MKTSLDCLSVFFRTFIVNFVAGTVTDEATSQAVAGYTGVVDEGERNTCGLGILAIDMEADVGQWSCLMNEGPGDALSLIHI